MHILSMQVLISLNWPFFILCICSCRHLAVEKWEEYICFVCCPQLVILLVLLFWKHIYFICSPTAVCTCRCSLWTLVCAVKDVSTGSKKWLSLNHSRKEWTCFVILERMFLFWNNLSFNWQILLLRQLWVSSSQENTSVEIWDLGVCSERS